MEDEEIFDAEQNFITQALNGDAPHTRVLKRLETKKGSIVLQAAIIETKRPLGRKIFYWHGPKATGSGPLSVFVQFAPEEIDLDDMQARGKLGFAAYRTKVIKNFSKKMKDDLGLSFKAKKDKAVKELTENFVKSVVGLLGEKIESNVDNSQKELFAGHKPIVERIAIESVDWSTQRAHPTDPELVLYDNALIFNAVVVNLGFGKMFFIHSKDVFGDDLQFKFSGAKQARSQYEELFGAAATASFEPDYVVRGNLASRFASYKAKNEF